MPRRSSHKWFTVQEAVAVTGLTPAGVRARLRRNRKQYDGAGLIRQVANPYDGGPLRWEISATLLDSWKAPQSEIPASAPVSAPAVSPVRDLHAEAEELQRRELAALELELERRQTVAVETELKAVREVMHAKDLQIAELTERVKRLEASLMASAAALAAAAGAVDPDPQ